MKFENLPNLHYRVETDADKDLIDQMHADVFGPSRFERAAHKVRAGYWQDPRLSFVAWLEDQLIGSVRLTRIRVGKGEAFLLGPLCVLPQFQGCGVGRKLVGLAIAEVVHLNPLPIFLVGDEPYYGPLGFEQAPLSVEMPGWVDVNRVLVNWLDDRFRKADYRGMMQASDSAALAVPHGNESCQKKRETQ